MNDARGSGIIFSILRSAQDARGFGGLKRFANCISEQDLLFLNFHENVQIFLHHDLDRVLQQTVDTNFRENS